MTAQDLKKYSTKWIFSKKKNEVNQSDELLVCALNWVSVKKYMRLKYKFKKSTAAEISILRVLTET